MGGKGYYLSIEAIVSIALLGVLLALQFQQEAPGLIDLHTFKKENDLLLWWARQGELPNENGMRQDFEFAFPEKSCEIRFDGKKISIGNGNGEGIAASAVFFDRQLKAHEITLIVFRQVPSTGQRMK